MRPNAFATMMRAIWHLGHLRSMRFGLECHDPGHLFKASHFVERDQAMPPLFVVALPGSPGGADTPARCVLRGN